MNLKLSIVCNLRKFWANQRGVFPPFMFGLLMGVSLFSVISLKVAQQQMVALEEQRANRLTLEREDLAKGLEFAILTETTATYSDDLTLERARGNTALTSGRTAGQEDFQIIERRSEDAFGTSQKRIMIANSDDTLRRMELNNTADARAMADERVGGREGVTLLDTSAVRLRQIELSQQRRDGMAEAAYRFYGGQSRFPTYEEYEILAQQLRLTDAWGAPLTYNRISDHEATVAFTTPWGKEYVTVLKLD